MKSKWRAAGGGIGGLALLFAIDAAVFRSGWYAPYLEPDSSAGAMQLMLLSERKHQAEWTEPIVLTMGDSRMNYSPKLANEYCAEKKLPIRFSHGGVAGTNPRCWHYMLREIDPTARRYKAIVLPVDGYGDEDTYIDYSDYPVDIHYLSMLLRWGDLPEYPLSYTTPKYALEAWRACLLKGLGLQSDVLALLKNPAARLRSAKTMRDWWPAGSYEYLEEERNVEGLSIDWAKKKATYPAGADDFAKQVVKTVLLRPVAPQTGKHGEYRRKWFGKIFERYKDSPTRFIFVMIPRGPLVRPPEWTKVVSHSVREFAKLPKVSVGDEHRYEALERPGLFKDALHMNREGSARYGRMLVDEIDGLLRN